MTMMRSSALLLMLGVLSALVGCSTGTRGHHVEYTVSYAGASARARLLLAYRAPGQSDEPRPHILSRGRTPGWRYGFSAPLNTSLTVSAAPPESASAAVTCAISVDHEIVDTATARGAAVRCTALLGYRNRTT